MGEIFLQNLGRPTRGRLKPGQKVARALNFMCKNISPPNRVK